MKNIFRKSVQIFHKDKKDKDGNIIGGERHIAGEDRSPTSSLSKKDKKHSKHHGGGGDYIDSNGSGGSSNNSPTLTRNNGDDHLGNIYINNHSSNSYHQPQPQQHQQPQQQYSPQMYQQQQYQPQQMYQQQQQPQQQYYTSGNQFIYNTNARKVFGVPLSQVPCRVGSNVPIIIEKLIDHIERTSLNSEGLFRIPGVDVTINQYIKLFDNGEDVDVSPIEPYTSAGLLKRFFRDLPVFVPQSINKRVASLFISEDGKKKQFDMEILGNLRVLVHQLPTVHFEVMQALTLLLGKLMSRSDQNKMTISNIAICLVPTLNCVPAIVTYPIQYFDFFFNEMFPQHHLYHMRPYQPTIEEKLEQLSVSSGGTQPMLIPHDQQKRYSRPASITISGLLPSNGQNSSPSSSTITSTTITSPHDSTNPITFTVTTTFSPEQQQQMLAQQQALQAQSSQQQQPLSHSQQSIQPISDTSSNKSERRTFKFDPNDLTQYIEDSQYNINRNYLFANNAGNVNASGGNTTTTTTTTTTSNNSNSGSNIGIGSGTTTGSDQSKLYRRSVAYTGNEDTKAEIQKIKEKIDRYSKEKKSREDKEREKLLRYSIDLERYKDRCNKDKRISRDISRDSLNNLGVNGASSAPRDINKEIEREIESKKRLSPRERLNLLNYINGSPSNSNGNLSNSSTLTRSTANNLVSDTASVGGSNRDSKSYSANKRMSVNQQLQMQLQQLQIQQQQYQQQQAMQQQSSTTSTNRYSSNRYKPVDLTSSSNSAFRYSREILDDDYHSNNNVMFGQDQQQPISVSSSSSFTRQRSTSCFEPENLIFLQQQYQQQQMLQAQQYQAQLQQVQQAQQQYQQQQQQPFQANPQFSNTVIEQKLDKIRDTINNLHRDNRVSRDYTHYLREVEDLRSSLQKETVATEFFVNKNQELEDKLRREEEKNQRLIEEIHLLETYFILKEKSKAKRLSVNAQNLTRSRSPTLPSLLNNSNGNFPPSLNSSSSSVYNNNNNNVSIPNNNNNSSGSQRSLNTQQTLTPQ